MSARRIPDALIERYLARDLPGELKAQLEATLKTSEAVKKRLQELEKDTQAFLIAHPPREGLARLPHRRSTFFAFWPF